MKKDDRYLNYLFTLGFILLIVIFIVSIVLISRVVLSEDISIGEHVKNTQLLLNDIDDVEINSNFTISNLNNKNLIMLNTIDTNITDLAYINVNENKTILTLFLTSKIEDKDNYYYLKIKNFSNIKKNDALVYNHNEEIISGKFLGIEEKLYLLERLNSNKLDKIDKSLILGRLIYSKNE